MRTPLKVRGRLVAVGAVFVLSACALYQANESTTGKGDEAAGASAVADGSATKQPLTPAKVELAAAAASTGKAAPAPVAAASSVPPIAKGTGGPPPNGTAVAAVAPPPVALADSPAPASKPARQHPPKAGAITSKAAPTKVAAEHPSDHPTDQRMVRYVAAEILNVRSAPRSDAPVVARLACGSMFTVTMTPGGGWAKIGDGQFVRAKYLRKTEAAVKRRLAARR